jgi:hypothetical protein
MSDIREDVPGRAAARQRERAERVERLLDEVEARIDDHKFPTRAEELAAVYRADPIELPNETESVASVLDRLDDRLEAPAEVRAAVARAVGGVDRWADESATVSAADRTGTDRVPGDTTRRTAIRPGTGENGPPADADRAPPTAGRGRDGAADGGPGADAR